jgi:hypothetical protein
MVIDRLRFLLGESAAALGDQELLEVPYQERAAHERPLLLVFDALDEASGWLPVDELPLPRYSVPGVRVSGLPCKRLVGR